ncbi:MAG: ribosomal protein S18-alanine N-acetyltransferase [Comamonas sp.]
MSSTLSPAPLLIPLQPDWLERVVAVEAAAYPHPWTPGNFRDALASGYQAQMLVQGERLLGYFVAMQVLDEVHLLNIAVAPEVQGQGCARLLLDTLDHWSRLQSAKWLWLEVRESNTRARAIYERHGYRQVGARKRYYPVHHGERETAIIMSMPLYGPEP